MTISELMRGWVAGWTLSRGTVSAVDDASGLRIDVGHPLQVVRHVVLDPQEASVRKLAETIAVPHTWIKAAADPRMIAPWLPEGWSEDALGWIMNAELLSEQARIPSGYSLVTDTWAGGRAVRVRVLAADGTEAAHGQVAVPNGGSTAVVDHVGTAAEYQRRGLGSAVMKSLANSACDLGARRAVLAATPDGRALYEALGWSVRAPLAGFIYRASDTAAQ